MRWRRICVQGLQTERPPGRFWIGAQTKRGKAYRGGRHRRKTSDKGQERYRRGGRFSLQRSCPYQEALILSSANTSLVSLIRSSSRVQERVNSTDLGWPQPAQSKKGLALAQLLGGNL